MTPRPITLAGRHVRLEPLSPAHAAELFAALAPNPSVFQWLLAAPPATVQEMEALVASQLEAQGQGRVVVFAQVDLGTGRAAGVTTYMDIRPRDRGLEVGGTWLGKAWQRSGINTEAKYLLLRHAFEELGAARVQLKTDSRNLQSQRAIERLGAVREGTLRRYQLTRGDVLRDTVLYSILDDEWPAVKARLEGLMAGRASSATSAP
jgi:RimJ/RimL family protein N-acetyltransferase